MFITVFVVIGIVLSLLAISYRYKKDDLDDSDEPDKTCMDVVCACLWNRLYLLTMSMIPSKRYFGLEDHYPQFNFRKNYGDEPWSRESRISSPVKFAEAT